MKRWLMWLGVMLLAAACQNQAAPPPEITSDSLVTWNRDPYHVVFRAELIGGPSNQDDYYRLNDVPPCTVYGDGRVVWTVDTGAGAVPRVLFDFLNDDQIIAFALFLSVDGRFLTYGEEFPNQVPSSDTPVYERMTLAINDVVHVTDGFEAWPPLYYETLLRTCQTLAPTPRQFEPEGAWLSARPTTYDPTRPSIFWDAAAASLSLAEVANSSEKRWIEGALVRVFWRSLRDNAIDTQFTEGDQDFRILLQVPGVTLDAPPAPAQ